MSQYVSSGSRYVLMSELDVQGQPSSCGFCLSQSCTACVATHCDVLSRSTCPGARVPVHIVFWTSGGTASTKTSKSRPASSTSAGPPNGSTTCSVSTSCGG